MAKNIERILPCAICRHSDVSQIECSLLEAYLGDDTQEMLQEIGKIYGVSTSELMTHAKLHISKRFGTTIWRQAQMSKANLLEAASQDALSTLQHVGATMRKGLMGDLALFNGKTLSLSELSQAYQVSADNLSGLQKTKADIEVLIHGPKQDTAPGLTALANVIQMSSQGA